MGIKKQRMISISEKTWEKIVENGRFKESADDVLQRLLAEKKQKPAPKKKTKSPKGSGEDALNAI